MSESRPGSTVGTADCFECGTDIPVAMWEDATLSGLYKPVCIDCTDTVPEYNLWEAPSDGEEHPVVDVPATLDDGEDWVVCDYYADWEDEWAGEDGTVPDWIDEPEMGETFEIVVRDASDTAAIEAARAEVRQRLAKSEAGA